MGAEVACVEANVIRLEGPRLPQGRLNGGHDQRAPARRARRQTIPYRVLRQRMRRARDGSRWPAVPAPPSAGSLFPGVFALSIAWQERYRVDVAHLDRQHRRIIAILDRAQYLQADDRLGVETVFNVLTTCMRRHFTDEEDLLAAHGYGGRGRQKQEHDRCLGELTGFQAQLRDGRAADMIAAFERIGDWFARHLEVSDKAYEPFLRAQGCR